MAQSGGRNLIAFLERLTRRSVLTARECKAVLGLPFHAEQVGQTRFCEAVAPRF